MSQPEPDTPLAPDPNASIRLFQFGVAALVGLSGWFIFSTEELNSQILLGVSILVLASFPALMWALHRRQWFPVFEISCLTTIAFYAMPLLTQHNELSFYRPEVVTESATLVVLYLIMANVGFA